MRNDETYSGKVTPKASAGSKILVGSRTRKGRQMVSEMAHPGGAELTTARPAPGAMLQQKQDWSRGNVCIPQTFVRLVGYRDPDARPSSPLPQRPMAIRKKPVPSDTPIG